MLAVVRDPKDTARLKPIAAQKWLPDRIELGERVAYVWCPNSILDSPVYAAIDKALRQGVTSRNWATTLKLAALAGTET